MILGQLSPSLSRVVLTELKFKLQLLNLRFKLEVSLFGLVKLSLHFSGFTGLFRLPLTAIRLVVLLDGLDLGAESLFEALDLFFEGPDLVILSRVRCASMARTTTLVLPVGIDVSLFS